MRKADRRAAVEVSREEQSDQKVTIRDFCNSFSHTKNIYSGATVEVSSAHTENNQGTETFLLLSMQINDLICIIRP